MSRCCQFAVLALVIVACPQTSRADATGEAIFNRHCVHCHGPGEEPPGTRQLRLTRGADKALLTARDDLTAPYIEFVVRNGLRSMPAFVPSDLTDERLQALTAYLTRRAPGRPGDGNP